MQTIINPQYAHLHDFIKSIPSRFNEPDFGTTLHSGRNIVKRVEFNGLQIVVKSYCRISLLNRLIYGRLRKSKSHRAYNHYLRLKSLGIDSPEAIAAIDTRHNGKIVGSFFVSLHSDYQSMEVVNEYPRNAATLEPLMEALAEFLIQLHNSGVLHHDLNISNILFQGDSVSGYKFQLIDTNRMDFKQQLSLRKRIENMRRLSCGSAAYAYLLERYAEKMNQPENSFELKGLLARLIFDERQRTKQKVKQRIKQRLFHA